MISVNFDGKLKFLLFLQVVRTFESEEKMDDHDSGEEVESDWIFFKAIVNNDGFFF